MEGCYIPFDWAADFDETYLPHIRYRCLVMSERYIRAHFADIRAYACVIEQRLDDSCCTLDTVLRDNAHYLEMCRRNQLPHILIDDHYPADLTLADL